MQARRNVNPHVCKYGERMSKPPRHEQHSKMYEVFTVAPKKLQVISDVPPCQLLKTDVSDGRSALIFRSKQFVTNVSYLPTIQAAGVGHGKTEFLYRSVFLL